jgi:hypothetical protein
MWIPAAVVPAWMARDAAVRHALARLGASLVAGALLIGWPALPRALADWVHAGCLWREMTGLPCPGCGITTSLAALGRGDLSAAWAANPSGLAIAALLVGQTIVTGVSALLAAHGAARAWHAAFGWFTWLDRSAVGGLMAVWLWRLAGAGRWS